MPVWGDFNSDGWALVELRGPLLFKLDDDGKLLSTNEPAERIGDPAPDLYGCLAEGRLRTWYGSQMTAKLVAYFQAALGATAVTEEKVFAASRLLSARQNCAVTVDAGPAFRCEHAALAPSGDTVLVTSAHLELVKPFPYLYKNYEQLSPCLVRIVDGETVAVCRTVRRFRTYVECGVDTLRGYEGRGYGTAVVRDWCVAVLQRGLVPLYSTQWQNLASRAVARKLKMTQYATDISIWLDRPN